MAKILGIIAVPYALIVVHSFTGTIFGVVKAREMWNTPLLPVHFVLSALASGFALVILVTLITSKIQKKEILSLKTYDHMGSLLFFFLTAIAKGTASDAAAVVEIAIEVGLDHHRAFACPHDLVGLVDGAAHRHRVHAVNPK